MEEKQKQIAELEDELSYSNEEEVLPPSDIVAFNELRSCADLFRMYKNNQLQIQPDFQRNFVWEVSQQTRFIDSLIKQLPIPSLCIGLDYKTEKRIVIDGLQRISTIVRFLEDDNWKLSALPDIDKQISGKKVAEIKQNTSYYDRIENFTISVTVLRYDFSKQSHKDYLFTIFHRLNTGGKKLTNQEIRNCIYSGRFNNLLRDVAKSEQWTSIFGETPDIDRYNNEEIVLRVLAFTENLDNYAGNLAKFLNLFMADKQNMSDEDIESKRTILLDSLSLILNNIDEKDIVQGYGKTLKEGLLVGISKNISQLKLKSKEEIEQMFENFKNDSEFSEGNIRQGLNATAKVQSRLKKSISIFEA